MTEMEQSGSWRDEEGPEHGGQGERRRLVLWQSEDHWRDSQSPAALVGWSPGHSLSNSWVSPHLQQHLVGGQDGSQRQRGLPCSHSLCPYFLRLLECGLVPGQWGLSFMCLDCDMEWRV